MSIEQPDPSIEEVMQASPMRGSGMKQSGSKRVKAERAGRAIPLPTEQPLRGRQSAEPPVDLTPPEGADAETIQSLRLIERRMQTPNPSEDFAIAMRDQNMVARWFNGAKEGRLYRAVHALGWRPVRLRDLVDHTQIADLQESPEGYVTRGEKGREVLMQFPKDAFRALQRRKVDIRERGDLHRKDAKAQNDALAEATAERFGEQAAEGVTNFHGTTPSHRIVESLED